MPFPNAKRLTPADVKAALARHPAMDAECFRARGGWDREPVFALGDGLVLVVEPRRGGYVVARDELLAHYARGSRPAGTHPFARWSPAGSAFLAVEPGSATSVLARTLGASLREVSAEGLASLDRSLRARREELWTADPAVFDGVVAYCGECVRGRVPGAAWVLAFQDGVTRPVVVARGVVFDPAAEVGEVLAHPRGRSLVGAVEYAARWMDTARSERPMRRLYADFNDFATDGVLPLTCVGSVESIAQLDAPLREDEEVWLSDGELGTRAWVFEREGHWEARSDWMFLPEGAGEP